MRDTVCGSVLLLLLLNLLLPISAAPESLPTRCVDAVLTLDPEWRGDIGHPGSALYQRALHIDNKRAVTYPSLVLAPRTYDDVAQAILAVRKCEVDGFTILGGGHSAAGYGLNEGGVVLDMVEHMSGMEYLNADTGVLRVQAGARFSDVYSFVNGTGWLPVGGGCPQVGLGGFLLGGGWSFLSRSYGLGADNVLAVRYALANGTVVAATEKQNPDLFWAARGGGGGSLGVAMSFDLQMHLPRSKDGLMVVGQMCWPSFAPVVLRLWSMWLEGYASMPDWMDIDPVWLPIGEGNARMFCFTVVCNNDAELCYPLLQPYLSLQSMLNTVATEPFLVWQIANVNVTDAQEGYLYLTSGILQPGALTLPLIVELMAALADAPSPRNLVLFHVGGGQIGRVAPSATAFPHRTLQAVIQIKAIWDLPEEEQVNVEWVQRVRTLLMPHLSGSYVNYIDPYFPDWETAYFGDNYERLLQVQREVDPDNFFTFPQAIGR